MLIPDRLPSLVLLVGSWVPPAVIGWAAAGYSRGASRVRPPVLYTLLTILVLGWTAAWFLFQLDRIPPYVPGATEDPTFAPPEAVAGLAIVAGALVLPLGAIACVLAFRSRSRALKQIPG